MTAPETTRRRRTETLAICGLAILTWAYIWLDRQWPGSLSHVLVGYAQKAWVLVWFSSKIWRGYRRRRPYWMPESWRRYLKLAAMPFAVLVLFFALVLTFDAKPELFGSRASVVRLISALVDIALMLIAVIGLVRALGWLEQGEPSEQFTRTGWFTRRLRAS